MKHLIILYCAIGIIITSCSSAGDIPLDSSKIQSLTKAEELLESTIKAHGGSLYDTAGYSFEFRDKTYTFKNNGPYFKYTLGKVVENDQYYDVLENGEFKRFINDTLQDLSKIESDKYANSLNSVIYFTTLPHKLGDPAVNVLELEDINLNGKNYKTLKIAFDQEGGGEDHDDEFLYWINAATNLIDYFAYSYHTNNGGVRFRAAYNVRSIDGIIFQDYINYEAPIGTPLQSLPELFEKGSLKELSRIETENVESFNNN